MKRLNVVFLIAAAWVACLGTGRPALADTGNLGEFYRGVRAMGMGDAMTALSDDADAVFYNPAGMALQRNYEFRPVNPKLDGSADDITTIDNLKNATSQLDSSTISNLFGKHIYGDATLFPSIVFPNFTLGYYENWHTEVESVNTSFPTIDATYIHDQGLIGGFAYETRGFAKHHLLRVGFTGKWLERQGFSEQIPLTQLITADRSYLSQLAGAKASGFGAGAGFQYEIPMTRTDDFILGSSWQDIGDTSFGNSLTANPPPSIRNNLAMGFAFVHRFSTSWRSDNNIKFSAEMRHVTEGDVDPRLKAHVGAELALGMVSLQGGLNQDSLTGGAKVNFGLLEVAFVTYGMEDQALAFMDRQRNYMLQITIKFDILGKQGASMRDQDRKKHPRDYY